MASVEFDQTRKKRIERIRPFLKDLSHGKQLKNPKAVLLVLIQDLKDEGNQLFKDEQHEKASDYYKYALSVVQILVDKFYHEVDNNFTVTLYCNGSLCFLKNKKFKEALKYSENALKLNADNVKAMYRKTLALQGLERYNESLEMAKEGMKSNPMIFKEILASLEEAVKSKSSVKTKSATASAAVSNTQNSDLSNEWLEGTNALKTEQQRRAVLEKMQRKKEKKAKLKRVVVTPKSSTDSDSDSDIRSASDDEEGSLGSNCSSTVSLKQKADKPKAKAKAKKNVEAKTLEPDLGATVSYPEREFKQVGAKSNEAWSDMGLDTFDFVEDGKPDPFAWQVKRAKKKAPQAVPAAKLSPVDITWPLDDTFQFRLACKVCFQKVGEGIRGYTFQPHAPNECGEYFLLVRRKDNASLNWLKIRPLPEYLNDQFMQFKMCQQFMTNAPCKIGEVRCTFPHNKQEMDLWYMEIEGSFSYHEFMNELRLNRINTSEELAARQITVKPEGQYIPGLNLKNGASQRMASSAPLAEPDTPAITVKNNFAQAAPALSSVNTTLNSRLPPKVGLLGNGPLHPARVLPQPLLAAPLLPQYTDSQQSCDSVELVRKIYDVKIVCPDCFIHLGSPGIYRYQPCTHTCKENVLAVKHKNKPDARWNRVRERLNHRNFPGGYMMCHSIKLNNPAYCRFGECECSFAHNEAEQRLWGLEKTGKFSITEFILNNRNSVGCSFTLQDLFNKHKGSFTFVCRSCFYGDPPMISHAGHFNSCSGIRKHCWDESCILAHESSVTGEIVLIQERKICDKRAFYRICHYLQYCHGMTTGACVSAHSAIERDVWMLERDTNITRKAMVFASRGKSIPPSIQQPQYQVNQTIPPQAPKAQGGQDAVKEKVPHIVKEYCGTCWSNGAKSLQDGSNNRCVKGHNNFQIKRVFLISGIFRELRNLPNVIPRNLNFVICHFIEQKKKCQYVGQGPCQFAHSQEERVLWTWMARNKVAKPEDVVKHCLETANKPKAKPANTEAAAAASASASTVRAPDDVKAYSELVNHKHYCRYCSESLQTNQEWEEHCASEKHMFNVNSDKDHQWNFRQPPWGQGDNLHLCHSHLNGGRCKFSRFRDMFNLCKFAHSQEELDEWKERTEWRLMKRALAKRQHMFSYMATLMEEYNKADSPMTVMSESLHGVQVTCEQPLTEYRVEKNEKLSWSFNVQTEKKLEKVALLHDNARLHFSLSGKDHGDHQIASGDMFEIFVIQGCLCYKVNVLFKGGMFGSFSQWVVFDFGTMPVLVKKINVELGQAAVHEKVKELRQQLTFDRWTEQNRKVVPFQSPHDNESSLMHRYREPSPEMVVNQDSVQELNKHNYVHKMHKLLELEEITRQKLISSFNLVTEGDVMDKIPDTAQHFRDQLYMKFGLTENLSEDTGAGKLILTNVRSVLLTRVDQAGKQRVYEAMIESRGRDFVILRLSHVCVQELQLKADMVVKVEVQFQLNRMRFIHMHYALDSLLDNDIVFPDMSKCSLSSMQDSDLKLSPRAMNEDQLKAVRYIVSNRTGYTPPFIMYGPFGTGKTETLVQAALVLLRYRPESRILICAQSNSAADLYITKHFDAFLSMVNIKQNVLLRIVSRKRRITSVPMECRKYCYYSHDRKSFDFPPASVVKDFRIVITTVEMSLRLFNKKLKGSFTHIFVDEAAQALECETIMPLTLATHKTCVVLSGDHLQISPKVYSAEARNQNFGMSLLERLYQYYYDFYNETEYQLDSCPYTILLSMNYRTKMEILRFISATFYGGPQKLIAGGNVPPVSRITPMKFFAVQGREVQEYSSCSFYNLGESSQIVELVIDLLNNWPQEWGRAAPEEIGVVAPYFAQVKQIRGFFKDHHGTDLRMVNVETVQNIQGKEFRALFISTVRTRSLLSCEHPFRALNEAQATGDIVDFAFLSDPKLLNTAFTRTKSLLAVVGDPLALCAIGDCTQYWRTYIRHCSNLKSIFPPSMTYDFIKSQVLSLQASHEGERLKEIGDLLKKGTSSEQCPVQTVNTIGDGGDSQSQRSIYNTEHYLDQGSGDSVASHFQMYSSTRPESASLVKSHSPPRPESVSITPSTFQSSHLAEPSSLFTSCNPPPPESVHSFTPVAAGLFPHDPASSRSTSSSYSTPSLLAPSAAAASIIGAGYVPQPAPVSTSNFSSFSQPSISSSVPVYPPPAPVGSATSTSGLAPLRPLKPLKMLTKVSPEVKLQEFKMADFPIKADEILMHLVLEPFVCGVSLENLQVECISVVEDEGQAIASFNPQLLNEETRRKMLHACASGKEFHSDAEIYAEEDENMRGIKKYFNYTEETLQAALHNQHEIFQECRVQVNGDKCVAKVLNPLGRLQQIEINGTLCRGRAFNNDEVVVEVLPYAMEVQDKDEIVQGRVVGILNRAVDHRYHTIICSADCGGTGLLTPINPGLPCFYNVVTQKHLEKVKDDHVCVYHLKADKTLSFSHYEKVNASGAQGKLFVVRYLKWLPGFFNPLGVVVGVIPVGLNLHSAQRILDTQHHVPQEFSAQVMDELQFCYGGSKLHSYALPAEMYKTRTNLTQAWTFSINIQHMNGLEVAFSVDQISDVAYEVCVHITDVALFVQQDSSLDKEALRRGVSLLPIERDPVPMLPSELGVEMCSLQPDKDRCTLCVRLRMEGNGEELSVVNTTIEQAIINSKRCFSSQDVEHILDDIDGAESDYLKSCIMVLHQMACMLRKKRKGVAHHDPELGPVEMSTPRAHHMVQEFMILTNHQVAGQLLEMFPQCTPLLQQMDPNAVELDDWKMKHSSAMVNSLVLSKPYAVGRKTCTCSPVCTCVQNYMKVKGLTLRPARFIQVLSDSWKQAAHDAPSGRTQAIQTMLASPQHQPECLVAQKHLHSITHQQKFVCSGDVNIFQQGHYNSNLHHITCITSPLQNYISIIVQRLITALIKNKPCPYSQSEISDLMVTCNRNLQRAESFMAADNQVQLAAALQTSPLTVYAVVKRLDKETIELCFPHASFIPEEDSKVMISALGLSDILPESSDVDQMKLTWRERIYDAKGMSGSSSSKESVELCPDRFITRIVPAEWQKMLIPLYTEADDDLLSVFLHTQKAVVYPRSEQELSVDVSSEAGHGSQIHHFKEFFLTLRESSVVQVQISAQLKHCCLAPRLQLLSLTPTLDLCLEHRNNPANCFAKLESCLPTSSTYVHETSYQQRMLPLLAVEAADSAVNSDMSATIHNVAIIWKRESSHPDSAVTGQFSLSRNFCQARRVFLPQTDVEVEGLERSVPVALDLLCVRYKRLEMPPWKANLDERVSAMLRLGSSGTWVGHCVVEKVNRDEQGMITVHLRLMSSSVTMPSLLLGSLSGQLLCTVQVIPKTKLFRQMEYAVACLSTASNLARAVALKRNLVNDIEASDVPFLMEKVNASLNEDQTKIINTALRQPFTIIKGTPGSGKTTIAAQLACLFYERNQLALIAGRVSGQEVMVTEQVLICASSNTVVDNIAGLLNCQGFSDRRFLRIYDEEIERQTYPVPHDVNNKRGQKFLFSKELEKMALHCIIRRPTNRYHKELLQYDSLFQLHSEEFTIEQVEDYLRIVHQAELLELQQAKVILATCSVAASPRVAMATNVKQVIVDNCESCMEVESLLPVIMMRSAKQLVVLGDEKQLQPAVLNPKASSLGLCKSLLERYSESAIKLSGQYRMQKGMELVPSICFYDGQLKPSLLESNSSHHSPVMFLHVLGKEDSDPAVFERDSYYNPLEAEMMFNIALALSKSARQKSVAVITPYMAQVKLMKEKFTFNRITGLQVNTIKGVQGCEFDIVLLSPCRSLPRDEIEKAPSKSWLRRHIGLAADSHLINTALTRAREKIFIFGNKHLLECHSVWKRLLAHCRQYNAIK